jgi:flagellar biosynthesis anti-sigma factor FlgM
MRINLTSSGLQPAENTGSQKTGQRGAGAIGNQGSRQAPAAGDSAQFSFDQTHIQSLAAQALSAPEVRQSKVASLAHAINTGEYRVDAAQVAGAIVSAYTGEQAN